MDAGLRAQPAVGVLSDHVYRGTFYSGDFAFGRFDNLRLELMRLCPPQVHTQDHLCPVLRFCPASPRLNVEIRIVGIHFAGKHAPKLQARKTLFKLIQVTDDFIDGSGIVFSDCQFEQFTRVIQASRQCIQGFDDLFQCRTLLPERLGAVRFVPDIRLFQFALNFGQAFCLAVVVKDTPSTQLRVQKGRLLTVLSSSFP